MSPSNVVRVEDNCHQEHLKSSETAALPKIYVDYSPFPRGILMIMGVFNFILNDFNDFIFIYERS